MALTAEEAHLNVVRLIAFTLADLALEGDEDEAAIAEMEDQMMDVAEMIVDMMGLVITSVNDDNVASAELHLDGTDELLAGVEPPANRKSSADG